MEDARNIDFHFQFLYGMKIKWTKTTRTQSAQRLLVPIRPGRDSHTKVT